MKRQDLQRKVLPGSGVSAEIKNLGVHSSKVKTFSEVKCFLLNDVKQQPGEPCMLHNSPAQLKDTCAHLAAFGWLDYFPQNEVMLNKKERNRLVM